MPLKPMTKRNHKSHEPAKPAADSGVSDAPPPEAVDDWPAEPFTAAKWGMVTGLALSSAYVSYYSITAFGINFYPGDAAKPIIIGIVGGTVIGFALGWIWYFVHR
jgi:hypothetical protein